MAVESPDTVIVKIKQSQKIRLHVCEHSVPKIISWFYWILLTFVKSVKKGNLKLETLGVVR